MTRNRKVFEVETVATREVRVRLAYRVEASSQAEAERLVMEGLVDPVYEQDGLAGDLIGERLLADEGGEA
jgi:hypothetical protein